MVFEVLGDTLLKLIIQHKYKGLPLNIVKSVTAQVNKFLVIIIIVIITCIRCCVDSITCIPIVKSFTPI